MRIKHPALFLFHILILPYFLLSRHCHTGTFSLNIRQKKLDIGNSTSIYISFENAKPALWQGIAFQECSFIY